MHKRSSSPTNIPGQAGRGALRRTTWFWAVTMLPAAFISVLFQNYFFIYATDVLLVAPAAVGLLVAVSRIYDGISDLGIAIWSDQARTRFGRRRPFVLAGGLLLVFYGALWLPPEGLSAAATIIWLGLFLILYETASTLVAVPLLALGIELGGTPMRRSRFQVIGLVAGLPMAILANLQMQQFIDSADARAAAAPWVIGAGLSFALLTLVLGKLLREPPAPTRMPECSVFSMLREVLASSYHRKLIGVQLAETVGFTSLAFSVPFVLTYIIDRPDSIALAFIIYLAISVLSQAAWVALIPRLGMKRIWQTGLVGWLCIFALTPLAAWAGRDAYLALAFAAGLCGGASTVVYAMLGDVADHDARRTGFERQAIYVTIYRLVTKLGGAVVGLGLGVGLQLSGFVPNEEQGAAVIVAILVSACLIPFIGVFLGLVLLGRYDLYEREGVSDGRRSRRTRSGVPV